MEARKITIVQTKNQKKSVIMSSAATLRELKSDLSTNGINYDGMTFYEGLSKTELKTDESILPHDIERNGVITNELVFMLTNAEKKIKSGAAMSRQDVYAAIKKHNLQDDCMKIFGKNFTKCKTSDLVALVEEYGSGKCIAKEEPAVVTTAAPTPANKDFVDAQARAAIRKLLSLLEEENALGGYQVDEVLDVLDSTKETSPDNGLESPYTQDEINKMFRGM